MVRAHGGLPLANLADHCALDAPTMLADLRVDNLEADRAQPVKRAFLV